MKYIDLTLPTPAENLACDEALLESAESGAGGELLRFWEANAPFVVVGYANQVEREVNVAACRERNIPILRRVSGGGTVLQGPGCLNYSVILRTTETGPLSGISGTNTFVMERQRSALQSLVKDTINIQGCTDLAIGILKFSGNAQRRRRKFLIFHGTFLLNFDISKIEMLLPMPSRQPDYRHARKHAEFLTNLRLGADTVKSALRKIWNADVPLPASEMPELGELQKKYLSADWNFKF